jgi:hypothetical protein
MTKQTAFATIKLNVAHLGGMTYISSDDVPGLHLAGSDVSELCKQIEPAIKMLFKLNRGLDVAVQPASSTQTFPRVRAACEDHKLAEEYVLVPAAAMAGAL